MAKIIISEQQYNNLSLALLSEEVGVPKNIIKVADTLYDMILNEIKSIRTKNDSYDFNFNNLEFVISDILITDVDVVINIQEMDNYQGDMLLASMGYSQKIDFSQVELMQINQKTNDIKLSIDFISTPDWELSDLYEIFKNDSLGIISSLAHELKHKFDKDKKSKEKMEDISDYVPFASDGLNFGIPAISEFISYEYYTHSIEGSVRPTEVATRMVKQGITRDDFYNFITSDKTFLMLKKINNFTFEYFMERLESEEDYIDGLLEHIDVDIEGMSLKDKINEVLRLVYVNISNKRIEVFMRYTDNDSDMLSRLFGFKNKKKDEMINNYFNTVLKYVNDPIKFFVDECERFNYVSNKMIKKISKVYALIPDETKNETNESIVDCDAHQKIMSKKYGDRPIDTEYKYKKR